jgi:hypothetical protein
MAHIKRGHQWEKTLVEKLDEQNLIMRFSNSTTLEAQIENDPRNHFYIINASFKDQNLFHKEYVARGTTPVMFGSLKPDFIEIWKKVVDQKLFIDYHIIDVKASKTLQVCPLLVFSY